MIRHRGPRDGAEPSPPGRTGDALLRIDPWLLCTAVTTVGGYVADGARPPPALFRWASSTILIRRPGPLFPEWVWRIHLVARQPSADTLRLGLGFPWGLQQSGSGFGLRRQFWWFDDILFVFPIVQNISGKDAGSYVNTLDT